MKPVDKVWHFWLDVGQSLAKFQSGCRDLLEQLVMKIRGSLWVFNLRRIQFDSFILCWSKSSLSNSMDHLMPAAKKHLILIKRGDSKDYCSLNKTKQEKNHHEQNKVQHEWSSFFGCWKNRKATEKPPKKKTEALGKVCFLLKNIYIKRH